MAVPSLDFSRFMKGSPEDRDAFCHELFDAMSTSGFVKLRNHSIPQSEVDNVFTWSSKFFGMPEEHKVKAAHPPEPNPHRGWSKVGQEKLSVIRSGKQVSDIKESFDQGPSTDKMYPNIWNEEADLPGFRSFMENFYEQCHELHMLLLVALAQSMGVKPDHLTSICGDNSSELRLNHYPATKCEDLSDKSGNMRISSHSDFGTITLLFQDSVGGLEVEDQNITGKYHPVSATDRTELIINVGDCLQRFTNDRLRSANHRVTLPKDLKDSSDGTVDARYSIAYFGKPNRDQIVNTVPALSRPGEPLKYTDDMTAWQFNQTMLLQTY